MFAISIKEIIFIVRFVLNLCCYYSSHTYEFLLKIKCKTRNLFRFSYLLLSKNDIYKLATFTWVTNKI